MESLERSLDTMVEHSVFLLLVLPLVGATLVALSARMGAEVVRRTALTNVLLSLGLTSLMVANYEVPRPDGTTRLLQMASESSANRDAPPRETAVGELQATGTAPDDQPRAAWAVRVAVGVDGVSLWFVAAVSVLMLPAILAHWNAETRNPAAFYVLLLLLQSALVGVFAALDVVLFCLCAEAVTFLMFLLLGMWGGEDRRTVADPFLHYQRIGSLLVFFGIIMLVVAHSASDAGGAGAGREVSFAMTRLMASAAERNFGEDLDAEKFRLARSLIVFPLLIGFAIKASLFPLHRWLPTTQTEAPAVVGIVLCGVSVNVGIYGCLRFLLPIASVPQGTLAANVTTWAVASAVMAGLLALAQGDFRRLIAYAVVGHAGVCLAGVFSLNASGVAGAVLKAISVGLALGGLAFLLGAIRKRYDTFEIKAFGGLMRSSPRLGMMFALLILSAAALPGSGGFAGMLATVAGVFRGPAGTETSPLAATAAMCGLVLIAAALIWMMQRVLFGAVREPVIDLNRFTPGLPQRPEWSPRAAARPGDLSIGECAALAPLLAVILWIGLGPQFFLDRMLPSIERVIPPTPPAASDTAASGAAGSPLVTGTPTRRRPDQASDSNSVFQPEFKP